MSGRRKSAPGCAHGAPDMSRAPQGLPEEVRAPGGPYAPAERGPEARLKDVATEYGPGGAACNMRRGDVIHVEIVVVDDEGNETPYSPELL